MIQTMFVNMGNNKEQRSGYHESFTQIMAKIKSAFHISQKNAFHIELYV